MDLTTVDYKKELLLAADSYCKRHRMTLGALGKRMVNDRKFFVRIKDDGASCNMDTFQRLIRELSVEPSISSPKKVLRSESRIST